MNHKKQINYQTIKERLLTLALVFAMLLSQFVTPLTVIHAVTTQTTSQEDTSESDVENAITSEDIEFDDDVENDIEQETTQIEDNQNVEENSLSSITRNVEPKASVIEITPFASTSVNSSSAFINAINNAANGDTISITGAFTINGYDPGLTGNTLTIPAGKTLTISSSSTSAYVITLNQLMFDVKGELILQNIILDGNNNAYGSGFTVESGGKLQLLSNTTIRYVQGNSSQGPIWVNSGGVLITNGATIANNNTPNATNLGTITIKGDGVASFTNTTISNNVTSNYRARGAIYTENLGNIYIASNVTFSSNSNGTQGVSQTWSGPAPSNINVATSNLNGINISWDNTGQTAQPPGLVATVTITLNPNSGTVTPTTITVGSNVAIGSLPTPTRTNYTFNGWYTAATNGTPVTSSSTFTANTTIYAQWTAYPVVTWNPNSGSVTPTTTSLAPGTSVSTLPTPTRTNYTFNGWYTDNGVWNTPFTTSTIVNSNMTVYARWHQNVTVTFNPNGGSVSPTTQTVYYNEAYGSLPSPTRDNYRFRGWYTASSGGTLVTATTNVSNSSAHTLYAQWDGPRTRVIIHRNTLDPNNTDVPFPYPNETYYVYVGGTFW